MTPIGLHGEILFILAEFLLAYVYIRAFISGIKTYQLNKSAYKKKKKGEKFWEWILLSRWKDEVPKFYIIFNYVIIILHLLAILFCIVMRILNKSYGGYIVVFLYFFNSVWIVINKLLFLNNKLDGKTDYSRWIKHKRGQDRKF